MPKNTFSIEIKGIPLEVGIRDLGYVEVSDLASKVEKEMHRLQEEEDIIDTLKQALITALEFAAEAYLKGLTDGGKQKEDLAQMDKLIAKLQSTLSTTQK